MQEQARFPREAWVPLIAGLAWLWNAPGHGFIGFLFSVLPGCLLLAGGISMLLMPGDRRIAQFAGLGGALGVLLALPAFFVVGFGAGVTLVVASLAGLVAAGNHSVKVEPHIEGVPEPELTHALSLQVGLDEALLATMTLTTPLPRFGDYPRIGAEIEAAREMFDSRGWLEKPIGYHQTPPVLENPSIRSGKTRNVDYERLSFDSEYEPHEDEPGRDRWLGYGANRRGYAWVLRHDDKPRPWLVCIHGYKMGMPITDLLAFAPEYFHEHLGLNMLVPVLPLHGPRKIGKRSGDGFIGAEVMDTVHAEAQAMWDIRRLLSWVRAQGDEGVGVLGLSLGGYNAALLASVEEGLRCAILGIPLADFARAMFRHGPALHLRGVEALGIDEDRAREVFRVVSPLALDPLVPLERRSIFAAVADRLVPADQPRDLWRHWGEPRIEWYPGAHLTFRAHPQVRRLVAESLRGAELVV